MMTRNDAGMGMNRRPGGAALVRDAFARCLFPPRFTMRHLVYAIRELKERFGGNLRCLETGTIRSFSENHRSTLVISEALGDAGTLVSVDIEPASIAVSREICRGRENIRWIGSDSLSYLRSVEGAEFHFVFLDSANDPELIFQEFSLAAARMVQGGILLIDDAGVTKDGAGIDRKSNGKKGRRVWEFLRDSGVEFRVLPTVWFHGCQLRIDLTPGAQKRILEKL